MDKTNIIAHKTWGQRAGVEREMNGEKQSHTFKFQDLFIIIIIVVLVMVTYILREIYFSPLVHFFILKTQTRMQQEIVLKS